MWGTSGEGAGSSYFLIYISDLHNNITSSHFFHFADDRYLLNIPNNLKKKEKKRKEKKRRLNRGLKELLFWLNTKKIALNFPVAFYRTKHQHCCHIDLNLTLCRKRINIAKHVRYLIMKIG